MKDLPYFKTSIFLHVDDDLDSESVDFEITNDDCFTISRQDTPACNTNPEKFIEISGFSVDFSINEAIRLRDFLNHALPSIIL